MIVNKIAALCLLAAARVATAATTVEVDGLLFMYNDDGTATVKSCTTATGAVTVRATVSDNAGKTYTVTSIDDNAFQNRTTITSVALPDALTTIGGYAFAGCRGLVSVTLPADLAKMGEYAFNGCTSLSTATLPDGLTTIEKYTFNGCTGLTSATLPASLASIGERAFYGCTGLTGLTLPASLATIGKAAFYGCSSLTSLTTPATLTALGESAFSQCSALTQVDLSQSTKLTAISESAFNECGSLSSATLPGGLTSIGDDAFYGCSELTAVSVPAGVTSIGSEAFYGCSKLASVALPESLTTMGRNAFRGCVALTAISLPDALTAIANQTFQECNALTTIDLPDKLTSIGEYAFYNCGGITALTLPDQVAAMGEGAFAKCSNLAQFDMPYMASIGSNCLQNCAKLGFVTVHFASVPDRPTALSELSSKLGKPVHATMPFGPTLTPGEGTVDDGDVLTLPDDYFGLTVNYTIDNAPVSGSHTFANKAKTPATVQIVATLMDNSTANVVVEGATSKTFNYTVRGQVTFTLDLAHAGGLVDAGTSVDLPQQQDGLAITYTIDGAPLTGTSHTLTNDGTAAKSVQIVATIAETDDVAVAGDKSKTFSYTVKGHVPFDMDLDLADGSGGLTDGDIVAGGSEVTLPATYKGLPVTYTVNGEAASGTCALPSPGETAQEVRIVATLADLGDGSVVVDGEKSKTFTYTVRGEVPFDMDLTLADGSVADGGLVEGGSVLTLPTTYKGLEVTYAIDDAATQNKGLEVTYTIDDATTQNKGLDAANDVADGAWSRTYTLPSSGKAAQEVRIVATLADKDDGRVVVKGEREKTFTFTVKGHVQFAMTLFPNDGASVTAGKEVELPTTYEGLEVTYTVGDEPASGKYVFTNNGAGSKQVAIVATIADKSDGSVVVDGEKSKTFTYTVEGQNGLRGVPATAGAAPGDIYNLAGHKLSAAPEHGTYIQGGKLRMAK